MMLQLSSSRPIYNFCCSTLERIIYRFASGQKSRNLEGESESTCFADDPRQPSNDAWVAWDIDADAEMSRFNAEPDLVREEATIDPRISNQAL